ncbi:MAG: thioredoxin-disulfide reductase [Endomicrobiia bacterium]|nr:thioredoxin-disulfide reductase [Endomicrobiaceae bacterium]MDD3052824.1 thioredoxin-disulfide reductase [Endomicrobiaceae bacterium]MDD3921956.1 thioredoxin-disulfide reductase [Endomicrobiaceae bacterium]MDD5101831.1 thioredoxin-disulfide reductase [Endomicrobiaceae bacterium]
MIYDVIIIGGGPAGLSAGIYSSRSRLKTLLIEKAGCGGQIAITDNLENYPGFEEGINGFDIAVKMEKQAKNFGTEIIYGEVLSIDTEENLKKVILSDKTYITKTIIIASGANFKKLNVKGEKEFIGRGVSYCATCDGPFFRNKEIAVVGGGDSSLQEALYLTKFASKVNLIHRRDEFRAAKILQERVVNDLKINVFLNTTIEEIYGLETIEKVKLKNVKSQEITELNVNGVFIFVGWTPNTNFLTQSKISLNENGYIITNDNMQTSISGIFACGDIRKKLLRQVVTAVGDGATASVAAQHYIEENI